VGAVVDHVAGHEKAEIGHVEHAVLVGVAVTDLDDGEVVTLSESRGSLPTKITSNFQLEWRRRSSFQQENPISE
jgi:hypothetical protein